ncbi:YceI family protein [Paraburkholderia aspalathi]|nr:YceI family protein [Paraburkholderia aspalathi]
MNKLIISSAFAIGTMLSAASAIAADKYIVDTEGAHASVNLTVPHLGFSYIVGRFNTFTGDFTFDVENPANSSVNIVVDTSSVDTNHAARDNHLRSDDFLNASKFPQATFKSTEISIKDEKTASIKGDLTIRDVTKPVVIEVVHVGGGDDPWGNYRNGFKGTTEINLKDFGAPSDFADLPITLDLHIEGVKQ